MGGSEASDCKPESVVNGDIMLEEKSHGMMENEERHVVSIEMDEGKKDEEEAMANDMDVDEEKVNETEEIERTINVGEVAKQGKSCEEKDKAKEEEEKQEISEELTAETKSMEIDNDSADKATEPEVELVGATGDDQTHKELTQEKNLKNHPSITTSRGRKEKSKRTNDADKMQDLKTPNNKNSKESETTIEKKDKEPETSVVYSTERPVRERKSVERLVASIEMDMAKEFHVEKGRGTALKDIPNVAYKLSRKKPDDGFKLLHNILFGRKGKAAEFKNNILRFSGFVWHDNEEKETTKLKEKLDKIVKEKLVEFCDFLDIQISKANTRKEDIITMLIDFLIAPHATSSELLSEKEQSSKGKKRKKVSKSATKSSTPSSASAKSSKNVQSTSKKKKEENTGSESEDESEDKKEDINGISEKSQKISERAESDKKTSDSEEYDGDQVKQLQELQKSSAKKGYTGKAKTKKLTIPNKDDKQPENSPSSRSKNIKDGSVKSSSDKKKDESIKEKTSTSKKSASSVSTGEKVLKVKGKSKEAKGQPSDKELREAICDILKEVDFNTATFTDILKLLAKQFGEELMSRKASVKLMIQDELTKLAEAEATDEEEENNEGDVEKDEKNPSTQSVKA